jgi:hypothetical protein
MHNGPIDAGCVLHGEETKREAQQMRSKTVMQRALTWLLVFVLAWPAVLTAQNTGQEAGTPQSYTYTQEQLDQLLAPIALYPDPLLSQILMASTYPLERPVVCPPSTHPPGSG